MQQKKIKIGKNEKNHILISKNFKKVSREHAVLVLTYDNVVLLEDNNSTHGTFVNGNQIRKKKLSAEDEVRLADLPLNAGLLISRLKSDLYKKQVRYETLKKNLQIFEDFKKLEQVYSDYIKQKRKLMRKSGLKQGGIRAAFLWIPFFGAMIGSLFGLTIDTRTAMDELNEQFKKDYICPNPSCSKFLGFQPFDNLKKSGTCIYCKTPWR